VSNSTVYKKIQIPKMSLPGTLFFTPGGILAILLCYEYIELIKILSNKFIMLNAPSEKIKIPLV
jgi:hypothetical protein